jgi:hypothetical protein
MYLSHEDVTVIIPGTPGNMFRGLSDAPEDPCFIALWSLGEWFVERFREIGRVAQYETKTNYEAMTNGGPKRDMDDPDATLLVSIE